MGKRRGGKKDRNAKKRVRDDNWANGRGTEKKGNVGWDDYVLESPKFIEYYKVRV
jgi:hypothetical protein